MSNKWEVEKGYLRMYFLQIGLKENPMLPDVKYTKGKILSLTLADGHGHMRSGLTNCSDLLGFVNHSSDWDSVLKMEAPKDFVRPKSFILEVWERTTETADRWCHIENINVTGVVWNKIWHDGGGESLCGGNAEFTYSNYVVEQADKREVILPPVLSKSRPFFDLEKFVQ